MKLLVSGATGFIGRALVPALVQAGHRVRLLLPPGPLNRALPRGLPVEIALGRLENSQSVRSAVRGVDVVIHLATGEHRYAMETLYRVDVQGTRHLVQAAEEAGVQKFVYLSHLGANPYAAFSVLRAKGLAEQAIMQSQAPWIIVRSGWVYGPGDHFLTPLMRHLTRWPLFPLPGGGETMLQPLWVEDLVALLSLLVTDAETRYVLEVGGPEHLLWKDLLHLLAHTLQRQPRFVPIPMAYARALATTWVMATRRGLGLLFWLDYMALDRTTDVDVLPRRFGLFPERLSRYLEKHPMTRTALVGPSTGAQE